MNYKMVYSDKFSEFCDKIKNLGLDGYKVTITQPIMKDYYDFQVLMEKPLTQVKKTI